MRFLLLSFGLASLIDAIVQFSFRGVYPNGDVDTTRYDTIRHDTIRHDTIRHDTTRYDTIRHDTTRYDTTRYDLL
ncbi:MAG: hypothetical protein ACTSUE_22990 [Promethearchaeota archaeon]